MRLWDNSGRTPKLIMEAEGSQVRILDEQAWRAFKAKAREDISRTTLTAEDLAQVGKS